MTESLQKSRTWFMIRSKCDVSDQTVSHPEVFISRHPKNNYIAEMAKLGENILLIKETGYLSDQDLVDVLHYLDIYISRYFEKPKGIFFLLDIKDLKGADSEARKRYIDYLKNSDIIVSMVLYNLSTLFKFSYKLTKRLHLLNDRLHAVDTYPQAIGLIQKRIARKHNPTVSGSCRDHLPEPGLFPPVSKRNTIAETMVTEMKLFLFNFINRLNGAGTEHYVEELLRQIQFINWYAEGYDPPDSNIYKHPSFRKVIDAIGFIKSEIDALLNERAEAELTLRESEAKYRQLVAHAKAGILEYDYATNRIIDVNDYFLQITEYSKDELLSINPLEILTEESRNLFLERLKQLMSGVKISQDIDYEFVTRSGMKKWVLFNTYIFYENDLPQKANVVITDITKLKSQQQHQMDQFPSADFNN